MFKQLESFAEKILTFGTPKSETMKVKILVGGMPEVEIQLQELLKKAKEVISISQTVTQGGALLLTVVYK